MSFDWAAFGAGLKGENVGDFKKAQEDAEWQKKERARKEEDWAKQDAAKKEIAAVSPQTLVAERNAQAEKDNAQVEQDASAARVVQEAFKNPAAGGIMLTPGADQSAPQPAATTFSADVQQRQARNPMMAGLQSAPEQRPEQFSSALSKAADVARAGIVADALKPQTQARPPAQPEAAPRISDHIGAAMKVLAIKQKYGQDTSMDQLKLAELSKELDKEGATHALALFHAGDFNAGLHEANNNGQHVGWKLDGKPQQVEEEVGGQKMRSYVVNLVNSKGETRQINTAPDMFAVMGLKNQIDAGQAGKKIENDTKEVGIKADAQKSTADYQAGMLGVARQNADTKLEAVDAKTAALEAKAKKGENRRLLTNDGVKQLDTAYGIKRDPISNMIDPDSIKDKAGYYRDSAEMERRVNDGENPMTVASELAGRAMRKQKLGDTSGAAATGTPKKLW